MQEVTVSTGQVFEVRPLKRKEVRRLIQGGMVATPDKTLSEIDEIKDEWLKSAGFSLADLDELEQPDIETLFEAVTTETFPPANDEKNSESSSIGPGPGNE